MDDKERRSYAYILCIGGKLKKVIGKGWWSTKKQMLMQMGAMNAAAFAFKKTASILVYEKRGGEDDNVWTHANACEWRGWYIPREITIAADNRILY